MRTLRGLIRGLGWFHAGRSIALPVPVARPAKLRRTYWIEIPLLDLSVCRWGFGANVGPSWGFLSIEIGAWYFEMHANTTGWGDW